MAHYKWEEMTQEEKYATLIGALNRDISWLKQEIEKSPDKILRVRARDLAKRLGPMFEALDDTTILWGTKYALYPEGIYVDSGREKITAAYLLVMRKGR